MVACVQATCAAAYARGSSESESPTRAFIESSFRVTGGTPGRDMSTFAQRPSRLPGHGTRPPRPSARVSGAAEHAGTRKRRPLPGPDSAAGGRPQLSLRSVVGGNSAGAAGPAEWQRRFRTPRTVPGAPEAVGGWVGGGCGGADSDATQSMAAPFSRTCPTGVHCGQSPAGSGTGF